MEILNYRPLDNGGKVKGFIFVDEAGTVRWLATDENYFE